MDQDPEMQGTDKPAQESPATHQPEASGDSSATSASAAGVDTQPEPKKRTNLIVGLIILAVFIIFGAAFLAWYCLVYSHPEKVVSDAMQQLLSTRQLTAKGDLIASDSSEKDQAFNFAAFTSNVNDANAHMIVKLKSSQLLDDQSDEFEIELGVIKLANGELYLQIAQLADVFDQYLEDNDAEVEDFGALGQILYAVVSTVDGEWWEVTLPEVLDAFGVDAELAQPLDDLYSCVMQASGEDYTGEVLKAYQDVPFLQVSDGTRSIKDDGGHFESEAPSGQKFYPVTIDYDQLANFLNALSEGKMATSIEGCYHEYSENNDRLDDVFETEPLTEDNEPLTADDLREILPEQLKIYLVISDWSHRLEWINFEFSEDDQLIGASISFDYQAPTIAAPELYRPATDFAEELEQVFQQISARNQYYGEGLYYINDDNWD